MLFFLLKVWLPRNGAKARFVSLSVVQRQPEWAPGMCRFYRQIPRLSPRQNVVSSPPHTNCALCRKLKMLQPPQVASARCFAGRVCIPRIWSVGGGNAKPGAWKL